MLIYRTHLNKKHSIMAEEYDYIELTMEDGTTLNCEIFDTFAFEDKHYALLTPVEDDENDDDEEEKDEEDTYYFIMRCEVRDDEMELFEVEDDEEFERVAAYVQSLEDEEDEEDKEGD